MQKCSYCGRENEDAAYHCQECGTQLREVPPDPNQKPKQFWNRPLAEGFEEKAGDIFQKLPLRECPCGGFMRPVSMEVKRSVLVIADMESATYQCGTCGKKRRLSPVWKYTALFFTVLTALPLYFLPHVNWMAECIYVLIPGAFFADFLRHRINEKKFPVVRYEQANARFNVSPDGKAKENKTKI